MSADEWADANPNPMLGTGADVADGRNRQADGGQQMQQYKKGDVIEHRLMPGFTMTVLDTRECETDANRSEPHSAYQVTDPEGNADWLCAMDVQRPGEGRAWS